MILNIPNILSLIRVFLIPVIIVTFHLSWEYKNILTASIFLFSGLTDCLDGILARKLDQMTRFGEFIDPVADKLIVTISLILLIESFHSIWLTLPAMLIIGRELVISALREWMAVLGQGQRMSVNYVGKVKTAMQMMSIGLLFLAGTNVQSIWAQLGLVFLYISAFISVFSMWFYWYRSRMVLNAHV
ncbi:MAG: CDP-diacylglycerol--glycerol-3-phosphate 3-phosphatidyltransferase [Endozoicomonadaceae bacterium]|nr:CDP-diacylglycerol--glycerol-3-phosphate 3-phosphatidyltransferase [Endozoicomonadaceae bacterium]